MYNMYKSMFNLQKKLKETSQSQFCQIQKHLKGDVKLNNLNEDLKLQT